MTVIVPVYNPGPYIEQLVDSLLGQTLDGIELVLVDDGSTDGTAERLDALALQHDHIKVAHIPNSGWPGRPRNVGLDMATGEFVFFADNDDWLEPEALERMYGMALTDDADIVVGKVVGHGKVVPRGIFRENRHALSAKDAFLFGLLTPHKLFRRSLLTEHGLRFPEGRRPLEDHVLVVPAFFHARRIALVADYPCYHWVLRRDRENASAEPSDMDAFHASVAEVLDLVDAHTEPGELRDRLYMRWYRGKLLGRVGTARFARAGEERRRERFDAARELVNARFAPRLDARLPYAQRLRASLLRRGSLDGLAALARYDRGLEAMARLRKVDGDGTWLTVTVGCQLRRTRNGSPCASRGRGRRCGSSRRRGCASCCEDGELQMRGALKDDRALLLLRTRTTSSGSCPPRRACASTARTGWGCGCCARVAPTVAAGGAPLPPGSTRWRRSWRSPASRSSCR